MKRRHHRIPGLVAIPDPIGFLGVRGSFSPATIFAAGAQGTWFRPNAQNTVYQQHSGSDLGVVGQPVGLLHDLSRGMTLGPNLVSNPGPFTNTTGYTAQNGAVLSVAASKLRISGSGSGFPYAFTTCATVVGTFYEFLAASEFVSGVNQIFTEKADQASLGPNVVGSQNAAAGPRRVFFSATSTTTFLRLINQGLFDVVDWDNIIVRTLAGIPALQATAGDRPILRQGGNGVRFIENVSADTLNWNAPAGTYTIAYVTPAGAVTILTGQALSGAANILLATQVVEYLAFNRALTTEETAAVTAYLQSVALP